MKVTLYGFAKSDDAQPAGEHEFSGEPGKVAEQMWLTLSTSDYNAIETAFDCTDEESKAWDAAWERMTPNCC